MLVEEALSAAREEADVQAAASDLGSADLEFAPGDYGTVPPYAVRCACYSTRIGRPHLARLTGQSLRPI